MMEMRLLKISDYQSVYNLWKNTSGMGLRSLDDSEEGIKRFLLRNPNTNFVAVIDKKIAGVIMAGNDGRRGYIYHLAVQNEYRRRGIASALVKECLMALRIEEINKVALVVFSDNTSGNNFWQKLGFIEREDLVYRNISINEENI
ncbi:GNAT family N-acetyltransferase [Thomasclavelia cocleata]|jgi:ribosomal protein S18 acetylase RimI-like enzyme|uniref:Acetyltransferase YpeA n=3 Tax=Thomasclavelia cocleata TaxID=69824 RepID=A0A829ZBR4_9FIRM|nr:acetyltransferase YpeA [Thomasclavelia cocleata]